MVFNFEWVDSKVTYMNLKNHSGLNILSLDDKLELWMPKLTFPNIKGVFLARLQDDLSLGEIETSGKCGTAKVCQTSVRLFLQQMETLQPLT